VSEKSMFRYEAFFFLWAHTKQICPFFPGGNRGGGMLQGKRILQGKSIVQARGWQGIRGTDLGPGKPLTGPGAADSEVSNNFKEISNNFLKKSNNFQSISNNLNKVFEKKILHGKKRFCSAKIIFLQSRSAILQGGVQKTKFCNAKKKNLQCKKKTFFLKCY